MGNVEGAAQAIADALAPTQQSPSARWRWGTVVSVQDDGTITAAVGGATVSGIRASQQAMGAAAGDRVRICYLGTEAFADSLRASSKLMRLPTIDGALTATGRITGAGLTSTDEVEFRNTNLTDGTAVSGIVNGSSQVSFLDSAGALIGRLLSQFDGSTQYLYQYVQRTVNGSTKRNGLALGLDASGNPTVYTNAQDAWLTALGFSPVYYRDGTGFSDVFTAASGFTVDTGTFRYSQRGKFATVLIAVKNTSALTAGTFYTIGTLASGRRPYTQAPLTDTALGTVALAGIAYGSGIVSVRPRGNVPANSSIIVGGTIILA